MENLPFDFASGNCIGKNSVPFCTAITCVKVMLDTISKFTSARTFMTNEIVGFGMATLNKASQK